MHQRGNKSGRLECVVNLSGWESRYLVDSFDGVQGVGSSNLLAPTNILSGLAIMLNRFFYGDWSFVLYLLEYHHFIINSRKMCVQGYDNATGWFHQAGWTCWFWAVFQKDTSLCRLFRNLTASHIFLNQSFFISLQECRNNIRIKLTAGAFRNYFQNKTFFHFGPVSTIRGDCVINIGHG